MKTQQIGDKIVHGPFARFEDAQQLVTGGRALGVQADIDGQYWAFGIPGQLVNHRTGGLERQLQMRMI